MKQIIYYGKANCLRSFRQAQWLEATGHPVIIRDVLSQPWTSESLRAFFGDSSPKTWWNPYAPDVVAGKIRPGDLTEQELIESMIEDPTLIKRPLIDMFGVKTCGFDATALLELMHWVPPPGQVA